MNPPDLKPNESLYNPDMNPSFYHPGRGFTAGTRVSGNWKPPVTPMTLVLPIPLCLPHSTIPTRNRNTRCLWSSLIPSRGTIPMANPGSGVSGHQVEFDGIGVSGFNHYRKPSGTGFPWSHHRTRPPCLWLLPITRLWLPLCRTSFTDWLRVGRRAPAPPVVLERFSTPNACASGSRKFNLNLEKLICP
jgi:hypothetical protein